MKKTEAMTRDMEDFFRIRFENKIAIRPRREKCHFAAATLLLECKQQLTEVETNLERCKKWYNKRTAEIAIDRDKLEQRDKCLRKSLLKFDKFLKENDSKRHRALKKVVEEETLQKMKDQEVVKLSEYLLKLNNSKNFIQQRVDENKRFQTFMDSLVEASEEYDEIHDVLSRYDVLAATKQHLVHREHANQDLVEQAKLDLIQYSDDRNTDILRLNNQLSELQTRFDKALQQVVMWENNWTRIKNTAAKKTLLLGQVKMATHNLYQLCSRYRQAQPHALPSVEETVQPYDPQLQLERVKDVLLDLVFVTSECKRSEQTYLLQQEAA